MASVVVWDIDGVIYDGRGTTYLARGSGMPVNYFISRFAKECGKEGPLSDINQDVFLQKLTQWKLKHQTEFHSVEILGDALTALRHEYGIFTSKHTKYTKNAILEGIPLSRIDDIMNTVTTNTGFTNTVEGLRSDGRDQVLFSNASYPIPVYYQNNFDMGHAEGVPTWVKKGEKEMLFRPEMYGDPDIVLAGKIEKWDKVKAFLGYMEDTSMDSVVAIDDDNFEMLETVKTRGGIAIGFKVKDKYLSKFKERKIPILKGDDLMGFLEIVRDPKKIEELCEV